MKPYTPDLAYDALANQANPADLTRMDLNMMAAQIAELIADDDSCDWPDASTIASDIKALARKLARARAAAVLGSATSPRKAQTSAANGRRGGRPRKEAAE